MPAVVIVPALYLLVVMKDCDKLETRSHELRIPCIRLRARHARMGRGKH